MKMRPSCQDCVIKHLSQAMVLMDEAILGYPTHRYLAIGHMAEAESEALGYDIVIAQEIRDYRLEYVSQSAVANHAGINLLPLIQKIDATDWVIVK